MLTPSSQRPACYVMLLTKHTSLLSSQMFLFLKVALYVMKKNFQDSIVL